jgi:AAA15 family ATPase/GTPase
MATKRKKKKSKGLGDTIEKFTEATGIKKVVKWIAGEDCGCDKRKEKLNQIFKYKSNPECLNESEYNYLTEFFKINKQTLKYDEQKEILAISNRVFNERRELSTCGSCVRELINQMKRLYDIYKEEHDK